MLRSASVLFIDSPLNHNYGISNNLFRRDGITREILIIRTNEHQYKSTASFSYCSLTFL
jgi:hypothetical protein